MGQRGHSKNGVYNFFLWRRKQKSSVGKRIFCTPQNGKWELRELSLLVIGCHI